MNIVPIVELNPLSTLGKTCRILFMGFKSKINQECIRNIDNNNRT